MATVFSNNVIEIACIHDYGGAPSVNVWHMWFDAELGSDTKEQVVRDFANNWQDHVLDLAVDALALLRFDWRSLDADDGSMGTLQPDPAKPLVGQDAGEGSPRNVAFLIHKNTSDRARGQRDGRCFLSGVPEAHVNSTGTIASAFRTGANTALASFLSGIEDISGGGAGDRYPVVLATTPASRAPGTASVTIDSRRVTSITLDEVCSTQRDRLR